MPSTPASSSSPQPAAPGAKTTRSVVTGVQLMQGIGHAPAKGFWADAWSQVLKRPGAMIGLCWVGVLAFFAVFAPILASGHPLVLRTLDPAGNVTATASPLLEFLAPLDLLLLVLGFVGIPLAMWVPIGTRSARFRWLAASFLVALGIVIIATLVQKVISGREPSAFFLAMRGASWAPYAAWGLGVACIGAVAMLLSMGKSLASRSVGVGLGAFVALACIAMSWDRPALERFDYLRREQAGQIRATYTLVPFSPAQRFSELSRAEPGRVLGEALSLPPASPGADRRFLLGTDAFGADVLSQIMHACRLSISIGLVSTGIALIIGVTIGAVMGYFGGKVDLVLYRVVEIFMAVPVLFLLIVAAAVLPPELRTTYVMMGIIGCFTWTGMARFTRAEFLKLRNQDFVQSAKAVGLPLRAILFKHMLPNGVAPVLVDTSFAVAAAITVEAVLSYLNLGPIDQPSWGRLLASAVSAEGEFKWWLAVFPGVAIFLSVLSYNVIGEALRDAIDPKLKKARV